MFKFFESTHSDYFGRKKSFFNKSYIDYCLKEISSSKKLTHHEKEILKKAKLKYSGFLCINFILFFYTCRRIYTKGLQEFKLDYKHQKTINSFTFNTVFSILCMLVIYRQAQISYYNDLKYLIKKYNKVSQEQYNEAELNKKIYELYESDLGKTGNAN